MTRPLAPRERAILDLLLAADFPGVEQLRAQARSVEADGEGLIIDLVVDRPGRRLTSSREFQCKLW